MIEEIARSILSTSPLPSPSLHHKLPSVCGHWYHIIGLSVYLSPILLSCSCSTLCVCHGVHSQGSYLRYQGNVHGLGVTVGSYACCWCSLPCYGMCAHLG